MGPGDVLADAYLLEARLGEGGMGEVFRAKRLADRARVAVKVLRKDLADDEASKRRFLREARAAMAVTHPNVVTMLDVHDDAAVPFLVMELLAGETLGKRLRRRGCLGVAETAAVMLPVFDAVEAAHAAGIVHRDLKPDNIFLAREGSQVRVCVLDFGIAKRVEKLSAPMGSQAGETTATAATTGSMVGTPYYMAPEQALGERDIDGRADLWSIGVILYECLGGRRPTEASTLGGVLKILVTGAIAPLADVAPELDPELADEVMDLLRAERESRATSLDALRTSLLTLGAPALALDVPADDADESPPSLAASAIQPRPRRPWLAPTLVAGLASIAVVAFVRGFGAPSTAGASVAPPAAAPSPSLATATAPTPTALPSPALGAAASPASASASASASATPPASPSTKPSTKTAPPSTHAEKTIATAQPSAGAPGRGPSGLVTDNPFLQAPNAKKDQNP